MGSHYYRHQGSAAGYGGPDLERVISGSHAGPGPLSMGEQLLIQQLQDRIASAKLAGVGPGDADLHPRDDRRVLPALFSEIQGMLPFDFSLDACANNDGSNALVKTYGSPSRPFELYDARGHKIWCNPPFRMILKILSCGQAI